MVVSSSHPGIIVIAICGRPAASFLSASYSPSPSNQAVTSLCASPRVRSVKEMPSRIDAPAALSSSPDSLLPKPPLALVLKGTSVLPLQSYWMLLM